MSGNKYSKEAIELAFLVLREHVEDLKSELESSDHWERRSLKDRVDQLEAENAELRETITNAGALALQRDNEIKELRENLAEKSQVIHDRFNECVDIRRQLRETLAAAEKERDDLAVMTKSRDRLLLERDDLKSETARLQNRINIQARTIDQIENHPATDWILMDTSDGTFLVSDVEDSDDLCDAKKFTFEEAADYQSNFPHLVPIPIGKGGGSSPQDEEQWAVTRPGMPCTMAKGVAANLNDDPTFLDGYEAVWLGSRSKGGDS